MSVTPPVTRTAPPALGEDTSAVLKELLGLGEADLASCKKLARSNAIGTLEIAGALCGIGRPRMRTALLA